MNEEQKMFSLCIDIIAGRKTVNDLSGMDLISLGYSGYTNPPDEDLYRTAKEKAMDTLMGGTEDKSDYSSQTFE